MNKIKTMYSKEVKLLVVLAGFLIANTLIAEFIGVKIFSLEKTLGLSPFSFSIFGIDNLGFNLTAGVLLWPVVFIMTDIINEYFGMKMVRRLSYLAIAIVLYSFFMIYGAVSLAPNDWWQNVSGTLDPNHANHIINMNLAFSKIFGQGMWIIIGSMFAFLVGQIVDVAIFQSIKKKTGESKVWLRATGSTLVSQFLDSYVVLIIAFYIGSDWDINRVLAIGTVNYLYKFFIAIILTPVIYLVHYYIDRYLGVDLAISMKTDASLL